MYPTVKKIRKLLKLFDDNLPVIFYVLKDNELFEHELETILLDDERVEFTVQSIPDKSIITLNYWSNNPDDSVKT